MSRSRLPLFILIVAASFLLSGACGLFNAQNRFAQDLAAVDRTIDGGNRDGALKRLRALRKKAGTASQFLSVAKRERSLSAWDEAADTLNVARFKMPANDAILAVLTDTLSHDGHAAEAKERSAALLNTTYAVQGAAIRLSDPDSERDPRWWQVAADLTGETVFRRNAAVWYAAAGNLPAACDSAASVYSQTGGRDRRMLALLYYDAGFPEQAIATIMAPRSEAETDYLTEPDYRLLADASLEAGNMDDTIRYWKALTEKHPESSPVSWYGLAVTARERWVSTAYLSELLDRFPAYYPAVARYVSNYLDTGPLPEKDSLTRELESRGFLSLSMKKLQTQAFPEREQVSERLKAAIASVSGAPDIRFFIEEIKVDDRDSSDAGITASRIWNLLERFSSNDLLVRYAMWFFLRSGQAETAFSLNRERIGETDPFYDALEAASKGDLTAAEAYFNKCAASKEDSWAALANIGMIRERLGDFAAAVDYFDRATSFAPDASAASDLQLDAALILARSKDTRRAQQVLMRALELDPKNERASAALRKLRGL